MDFRHLSGLRGAAKAVSVKLAEHTPTILTLLGIAGFGTTVVLVAKAAPTAADVHARECWNRECPPDGVADIQEHVKESYKKEAVELAKLYGPAAAVGVASVTCFVAANKVNLDRQAAVMAAYSLSTETLARYQDKVIEKLGEEVHGDILNETTKDIVTSHLPENDPAVEVVPQGMVRVYDNVTGRYFYSSRELIMGAESSINKRLIDEVRVPLQEFYYEMGLEETFKLGDAVGWDISSPYAAKDNSLNVWFSPHLDDDKNPCLAINYHVVVFDRRA